MDEVEPEAATQTPDGEPDPVVVWQLLHDESVPWLLGIRGIHQAQDFGDTSSIPWELDWGRCSIPRSVQVFTCPPFLAREHPMLV